MVGIYSKPLKYWLWELCKRRRLSARERLDPRWSDREEQVWTLREGTEAGEAWWASKLVMLHRASLPLALHIQLIVNPVGSCFRIFPESDSSSSLPLYTTAPAIIISYLDQCHGLLTGLPTSSPDTAPHLHLCVCSFLCLKFFLWVPLVLTLHLFQVLVQMLLC